MTGDVTAMQRRIALAHGIELGAEDAARMAAQATAAAALLGRLSQGVRAQAGDGVFFALSPDAHAAAFGAALEGTDG